MATPTTPGLLSLPTFNYSYDPTRLQSNQDGSVGTTNFLGDYYGQMAGNYLPSIDAFSQANAGQMVSFDPNSLKSIEDFGLDAGKRGALRGNITRDTSHQFAPIGGDNTATDAEMYYDANGRGVFSGTEGQELFRRNETGAYDSAGVYHQDTTEDALN